MKLLTLWRGETRSAWILKVTLYVAVIVTVTLAIQLFTWLR